jgi:hypothetical protein
VNTPVEAVVQAGGTETRYVSRGRGRPAVLVAATDRDRQRLSGLLTGECRIIEPVPPGWAGAGEAERLGRWLLGVIEGLGLEAAHVLLAPSHAGAAPEIAAAVASADATVAVAVWQED